MATNDGTTTLADHPAPPAEPPIVGLIASLGAPGGPYLDPPDDFDSWTPPPLAPGEEAPWFIGPAGPTWRGTDQPPAQRWEISGYEYLPEQVCSRGGVFDPCTPHTFTPPGQPSPVIAQAFGIEQGDVCSTFGFEAHDFVGRATRGLIATESALIANEMWTGAQAKTSGWSNRYLNSTLSDTLTSGAATPANALALLEQGLAQCGNGQRGAIYCTRALGALWGEQGNVLRLANGVVTTILGTIIIPDAGFDGSGPGNAPAVNGSQWAYATLMPQVRRSPIVVYPGSYEEATIANVNKITYVARRMAAYSFPLCCHLAVEVNVPLALVGGVS